MSKLICDSRHGCKEEALCGGSKPHDYIEGECNKCPMNKEARCVEAKINDYPNGENDGHRLEIKE